MNKQTQETMFSSKSNEWETPQSFFDRLNETLGPFTLDPCATKENAKCDKYYKFLNHCRFYVLELIMFTFLNYRFLPRGFCPLGFHRFAFAVLVVFLGDVS